MKDRQRKRKLFRTRLFGGYNKSDVDRYILRLEKELIACRSELDERIEENEKNQQLIEEAIRELRSLCEKDKMPQSRQERGQRRR